MNETGHNPADELRRVVAEGGISEIAVQTITGIAGEHLAAFLDEANSEVGLSTSERVLSSDEGSRITVFTAQIVQGMQIGDDDRLKAILEGLTIEFKLTPLNIALLTRASLDDIEACLVDPGVVPPERKYPLGIRISYLNLAIANARGY